jgi:hypothetical protein
MAKKQKIIPAILKKQWDDIDIEAWDTTEEFVKVEPIRRQHREQPPRASKHSERRQYEREGERDYHRGRRERRRAADGKP